MHAEAYLWTTEHPMSARNMPLLDAMARAINQAGLPFILAGDFQNDPAILELCGWCKRLGPRGAAILAPSGTHLQHREHN